VRQFGVVACGGYDNTATFQDALTASRGGRRQYGKMRVSYGIRQKGSLRADARRGGRRAIAVGRRRAQHLPQTEPISIAIKPLACDSRKYSICDVSGDGGVVGGNNMSVAYQKASASTSGHKLEVRFAAAPPVGAIVRLQWVDPRAFAAIDAVDDSHDISEFYLVGGQRVGFRYETGDGADRHLPSYVELQNQCSSVETGSAAKGGSIEGGVVRVLRSPNLFPFIADSPGSVSASGRNSVAWFNNVCRPQ
jgi:hypothetical protein